MEDHRRKVYSIKTHPWLADLASPVGSQEVIDTPINSNCRLANNDLGSGWFIRLVKVGSHFTTEGSSVYTNKG